MNKARRRFPLPLIIVPAAILTAAVFILILYSFTQFRVHSNLSDDTKKDLASLGNASSIADYIERYGERGPMDIDYQIETYKFGSLEEMDYAVTGVNKAIEEEINALLGNSTDPSNEPALQPVQSKIVQAVLNGTPRDGKDLKGEKVKIYTIDSYSPSADKNYRPGDSYSQEDYWHWTYSVFEYSDGTYRYVVNVQTC